MARFLPRTTQGCVARDFSGFIEPCLATLSHKPPEGDRWVHEIKFDGYRAQAQLKNHKPKILTRRGYDWTRRFASIASALAECPARHLILDGEIIVPRETAQQLRERLNPLIQSNSPLTDNTRKPHALWVKPELCAEVNYTEVTFEGRLRHASFKRLKEADGSGKV